MTPYQLVTPILSVLALAYAWNLVLRKKKTLWEALLWTLFWGGIALIALKPDVLSYLSTLTGIKDQVNAIFVTSIGILFFLVFYIIVRIEELHQRYTRMIREMALREAGIRKGEEGEEGEERQPARPRSDGKGQKGGEDKVKEKRTTNNE